MLQMTRREQLGALILAALLIIGLVLRFIMAPKPMEPLAIEPPTTNPTEETREPVTIVIHVAGAVVRPGVYTLPEGARVYEALDAAGGVLEEADPHVLNLAEPLYDGRRISVPSMAETKDQPAGGAERRKVNINTATATEFETLPGIGPAKAAAIISYREANGPFRTIDDLVQVSGIGPQTVEGLKEHITLY
jgi:competence protein ComEA